MKQYASKRLLVVALVMLFVSGMPCRLGAKDKPPLGHAPGQVSDVFLLLQGPFVFCEDQENNKMILRAFISPIVGDHVDKKVRHFKPAFYSNDSIYLGEGDYRLQIMPEMNRTGQIDRSQGILDSVYKACPHTSQKYLSVVFPMPDEIVPVEPVYASFDEKCDGHPPATGNDYATQVSLRYSNVSLDDFQLFCDKGNCKKPGDPPFSFDPRVRYISGLGGLVRFEVKPVFEENPNRPHEFAKAVHGTIRKLIADGDPTEEKRHCLNPLERRDSKIAYDMENRTPRRDCHAPELLLCMPSGSGLCHQK